MVSANGKPTNVKLRKGRWVWEPSAKLRRLTGAKNKPLGADQAAAWAYAHKLNAELAVLQAGAHAPGTVDWLFEQFFAAERFARLAPSTQKDYRWLAKCVGALTLGSAPRPLGEFAARSIKARHADAAIAQITQERGHSTAHYCARVARRIWNWAGRKEFVDRADNPWSGMELKGLPERDQTWTPAQVAAVIAKAEEMGAPSIALAVRLAYAFAHRKGDILTLTWTALDAGKRGTSKTKVKLHMVLAAYPELEAAIAAERVRRDASPTPSIYVVVRESTGRPWQVDVFAHHFRQVADAAGIPKELQFRDLRATAATEMADGGADILQMSTHTGHRTATMARRYARPTAEQFQHAAAKRQAAKEKK